MRVAQARASCFACVLAGCAPTATPLDLRRAAADTFPTTLPATGMVNPYLSALAADLDGDDVAEVFVWGNDAWALLRRGGDGRYAQADAGRGVFHAAGFGDLDGDGRPELVLTTQALRVLRYEQGRLADVAIDAPYSTAGDDLFGVTFADVDGDGLLDLALGDMSCGSGHSHLLRNEGGLHFVDVGAELGFDVARSASFAFAVEPLRDDGELHLWSFPEGCVDVRQRYWRLTPGDDLPSAVDRTFTSDAHMNPMGSAVLDVDRDGLLDVFFAGPAYNQVFYNADLTHPAADARGLAAQPRDPRQMSAWATVLFDGDLDGSPELVVAGTPARPDWPADGLACLLYRRASDGTFVDVGSHSGFAPGDDAQAAVGVDVDLDGDTDLLVGGRSELRLYENHAIAPERGRTVVLHGRVSNTDGVHALLSTSFGEQRVQRGGGQPAVGGVVRETLRLAGGTLTVHWPSGIAQTVPAGDGPTLHVSEPVAVTVSPRRVEAAAVVPVEITVSAVGFGDAARDDVRVVASAGAWREPVTRGPDGTWRGHLVAPAASVTIVLTVTVGSTTLRVRPRIFVR